MMVIGRKDGTPLPSLPQAPISSMLFGRPEYEGNATKATVWSCRQDLLRRPPRIGPPL